MQISTQIKNCHIRCPLGGRITEKYLRLNHRGKKIEKASQNASNNRISNFSTWNSHSYLPIFYQKLRICARHRSTLFRLSFGKTMLTAYLEKCLKINAALLNLTFLICSALVIKGKTRASSNPSHSLPFISGPRPTQLSPPKSCLPTLPTSALNSSPKNCPFYQWPSQTHIL